MKKKQGKEGMKKSREERDEGKAGAWKGMKKKQGKEGLKKKHGNERGTKKINWKGRITGNR